MANEVIEKLVAELGFNVDNKDLNNFQNGISSAVTNLKRMGLVVAGTVGGLATIGKSSSNSAENIGILATNMHLTTDEFQRLKNTFESQNLDTSILYELQTELNAVNQGFGLSDRLAKGLSFLPSNTLYEGITLVELLKNIQEGVQSLESPIQYKVFDSFKFEQYKLRSDLISGKLDLSELDIPIFSDAQIQEAREINTIYRETILQLRALKNEFASFIPTKEIFLGLQSIVTTSASILQEYSTDISRIFNNLGNAINIASTNIVETMKRLTEAFFTIYNFWEKVANNSYKRVRNFIYDKLNFNDDLGILDNLTYTNSDKLYNPLNNDYFTDDAVKNLQLTETAQILAKLKENDNRQNAINNNITIDVKTQPNADNRGIANAINDEFERLLATDNLNPVVLK